MINLPLWRDLSIVLLSVEVIIGLVPILVILYYAVKYVPRGIRWLKGFLVQAQMVMYNIQDQTLKVAQIIISPIIAIRQFVAAGEGIIRGIRGILSVTGER